jgi:hypothetical protein
MTRLALLLGLLFTALHNSAQTTHPLTGTVRDPTGALVPGASVQLTSTAGRPVANTVTNPDGRFQMPQPAPGSYHLSITRAGFSPLDAPLHVSASQTPPLALTLALADVTASVSVDASDVDAAAPDNNQDTSTITAEDTKNLPIFDGDIVAALAPFLDPSVTGETGTTLIVDGVETQTLGVSPSAIQSITTNEDPFSAQYGTPGRGQVEIITKAAAEHFHGSATFTYRTSAFYAKNYFSTIKPPEQRRIYEGYLTGPVGRLKNTAFLFSFQRKERDAYSQVLAATVPTPLAAANIYSPTRNTQLSMKVSHQYNDHHSGYLLYAFQDSGAVNSGIGGLVQQSAGYSSNDFDQNLTYHDDLTIGATRFNQFVMHYERDDQSVIGNQHVPQVLVEGVATFGGSEQDAVYTENNPTFSDIFTWTLNKHVPQILKFGFQLPNLGRRVWVDHTDRDGTFTFASVAAYLAGTPSAFSIQQGQDTFETLYAQPSAFLTDQVQLTSRLTATAGVRYSFQNTLAGTKDGVLPRLSFAYLLNKPRAIVLRTGGGFYIRTVGVNIGQQLARYQFASERSLLLTSNLCYPNINACNNLALAPPSLFVYAPNLQAPQQGYFTLSLEGKVTHDTTLTIAYNGYRGWHALRSVDINAPLPPFLSPARPNPAFSQVLQLQSEGYQKTDGMTVNYKGRIRNIVSGFLQYTLQHADSNTEYSTFIPQNQYDPSNEWSRSSFDQRQRFGIFTTLVPDFPVNLGIAYFYDSPTPYTITTGTDVYQTGLFNARPAGVPRNSLNAAPYQDLQLRLNYTYKFHAKPAAESDAGRNLLFSLSSFNTLNHPSFENFVGVVTSPSFMQPTAAGDPRRLQLSATYSF